MPVLANQGAHKVHRLVQNETQQKKLAEGHGAWPLEGGFAAAILAP